MADSEFNQKVKLISIDRLGYGSSDLCAHIVVYENIPKIKKLINQLMNSDLHQERE